MVCGGLRVRVGGRGVCVGGRGVGGRGVCGGRGGCGCGTHSCVGQRTFCGIWFSPSHQGSLGSNLGVRLGSKCLYLLNHLACLFLYIS